MVLGPHRMGESYTREEKTIRIKADEERKGKGKS